MFRVFIFFLGYALSGCAAVGDDGGRMHRWSLEEEVAYFDRFHRSGFAAELIYAPLRSAGGTPRYAALMRDVSARLESCDQFLLLQEIWEGGAEFSGGWLCRSPSGATTATRFRINEDDEVVVEAVAAIDSGNLQSSVDLLAKEKDVNTDRHTSMDGITAIVTSFESGLVRKAFYAPVSIDLDAIAELDAKGYEGFDRFYVGINRILEGVCTSDCF